MHAMGGERYDVVRGQPMATESARFRQTAVSVGARNDNHILCIRVGCAAT